MIHCLRLLTLNFLETAIEGGRSARENKQWRTAAGGRRPTYHEVQVLAIGIFELRLLTLGSRTAQEGRTACEDKQWRTARGRRALSRQDRGGDSSCCSRTSFPLAEKYRYLPYDSVVSVTNFEFFLEPPKKAIVSSGGGTARENEQWTAGGRRALSRRDRGGNNSCSSSNKRSFFLVIYCTECILLYLSSEFREI